MIVEEVNELENDMENGEETEDIDQNCGKVSVLDMTYEVCLWHNPELSVN